MTQIPAGDLERETLAQLRRVLRTPGILAATSAAATAAGQTEGLRLDHKAVVEAIRNLDEVWEELYPAEQERIVERLVERLEVGIERCDLQLRIGSLAGLAAELRGLEGVELAQGSAIIHLGVRARRRCGRTQLVAPPQVEEAQADIEPDALVTAIARAFRWQEQIESGDVASVTAMAEREDVDEAFIRRQLRLTLHPPRIIEVLVAGGDGVESIQQRFDKRRKRSGHDDSTGIMGHHPHQSPR